MKASSVPSLHSEESSSSNGDLDEERKKPDLAIITQTINEDEEYDQASHHKNSHDQFEEVDDTEIDADIIRS